MAKDDLKKVQDMEKKIAEDLRSADALIKKSAEFRNHLHRKVEESVVKNNQENKAINDELEKISDDLDKGFLEVVLNAPQKKD
ncbi:MAG: hypothetical protein EXS49_00620 [Candidatus Pacebacteria bacterium]|nr:hypothetical protein [Candidatus Paceibacterota bacterium]